MGNKQSTSPKDDRNKDGDKRKTTKRYMHSDIYITHREQLESNSNEEDLILKRSKVDDDEEVQVDQDESVGSFSICAIANPCILFTGIFPSPEMRAAIESIGGTVVRGDDDGGGQHCRLHQSRHVHI